MSSYNLALACQNNFANLKFKQVAELPLFNLKLLVVRFFNEYLYVLASLLFVSVRNIFTMLFAKTGF